MGCAVDRNDCAVVSSKAPPADAARSNIKMALSTAAITGLALGVTLCLVLSLGGLFWWKRRKRYMLKNGKLGDLSSSLPSKGSGETTLVGTLASKKDSLKAPRHSAEERQRELFSLDKVRPRSGLRNQATDGVQDPTLEQGGTRSVKVTASERRLVSSHESRSSIQGERPLWRRGSPAAEQQSMQRRGSELMQNERHLTPVAIARKKSPATISPPRDRRRLHPFAVAPNRSAYEEDDGLGMAHSFSSFAPPSVHLQPASPEMPGTDVHQERIYSGFGPLQFPGASDEVPYPFSAESASTLGNWSGDLAETSSSLRPAEGQGTAMLQRVSLESSPRPSLSPRTAHLLLGDPTQSGQQATLPTRIRNPAKLPPLVRTHSTAPSILSIPRTVTPTDDWCDDVQDNPAATAGPHDLGVGDEGPSEILAIDDGPSDADGLQISGRHYTYPAMEGRLSEDSNGHLTVLFPSARF